MSHATYTRPPRGPTDQGSSILHEYRQNDGTTVSSCHPDVLSDNLLAWARADASTFSKDGQWPYLVTMAETGETGVLTTYLNCCVEHNTMTGCKRHHRCRYYHERPGLVMSNLPLRQPQSFGALANYFSD